MTLVLLSLSIIITSYLFIIINLFSLLLDNGSFIFNYLNGIHVYLTIFIFSILLMFNKTKIIIKRFFLVNFSIFIITVWTCEYMGLGIQYDYLTDFLSLNVNSNNIYLIAVASLAIFEILFYFWSYISYKNNISNWLVAIPNKDIFYPVTNIMLFYLGIFIYYYFI